MAAKIVCKLNADKAHLSIWTVAQHLGKRTHTVSTATLTKQVTSTTRSPQPSTIWLTAKRYRKLEAVRGLTRKTRPTQTYQSIIWICSNKTWHRKSLNCQDSSPWTRHSCSSNRAVAWTITWLIWVQPEPMRAWWALQPQRMPSRSRVAFNPPTSPQWFKCNSFSTTILQQTTMWVTAQMELVSIRTRLATNWWSIAMSPPPHATQGVTLAECQGQPQQTLQRVEAMLLKAICTRWWTAPMNKSEFPVSTIWMGPIRARKITLTTKPLLWVNLKGKRCRERATVLTLLMTTLVRNSSSEFRACGTWPTRGTIQKPAATKLVSVAIRDELVKGRLSREDVALTAKSQLLNKQQGRRETSTSSDDINLEVVLLTKGSKEKFFVFQEAPLLSARLRKSSTTSSSMKTDSESTTISWRSVSA